MALNKENLPIPFVAGVDQKTDPLQLVVSDLIALENAVFLKDKRLAKRNGFPDLVQTQGNNNTTLTTFRGNLVAIGDTLQAFSEATNSWLSTGNFQPVKLSALPLVRSSLGQSKVDSVVASNGLVLVTYLDSDSLYKYIIADSITGQQIVLPQSLPSAAKSAKAFLLGNYFIVTYLTTVTGTPRLIALPIPMGHVHSPLSPITLSSSVLAATAAYDGIVANDKLYMAWAGSDIGGAVRITSLNKFLTQSTTTVVAGDDADLMSLAFDSSNGWVWVTVATGMDDTYTMAFTSLLAPALANTAVTAATTINQLTSLAANGVLTIYQEVDNDYSYNAVQTDYLQKVTVTSAGVVGSPSIFTRSAGLASKAFVYQDTNYMLVAYGEAFQPTYFLMDDAGNIVCKVAYSNGGGYVVGVVLPSVTVHENLIKISSLYKSLEAPLNKSQGSPVVAGVYSQTGINLDTFDLSSENLTTAEIGNNLHIAGGFLWMYDGNVTVEHGFHVWPENVDIDTATSGGSLANQQYFYQVTYEWTDAQGNIHRSAPSVPFSITTTGSDVSTNTLDIPTLRLTYKSGVRICIYRWSVAQQTFYQITSITSPTLNNKAVDSITYTDTQSDADILGNTILYTTGGVVENIAAPACNTIGLYRSRLMIVPSEDQNLVWFSKQVIEAVPVETSDLFTIYIAPTMGAQGPTGPALAVSAMDDKFVVFKADAIYYITGDGPNDLGQDPGGNGFSSPQYITTTVGCSNQKSIVFSPMGLMFKSDKGIWLLSRDTNTSYIGAKVEDYNQFSVTCSENIPGTNQVRFCLSNGKAAVYDYYFGRWGTFTNIPAISSTLYQGKHTYLSDRGVIRQEQEGVYQDGSAPVLMSFTTAWMNLSGVQGFERMYMFYLLGSFISSHNLSVTVAYDYNSSPSQTLSLVPGNSVGVWGYDTNFWGSGNVWGGTPPLEQFRIFNNRQKLQSMQVAVQENYVATPNTPPGAGLTFSGLNFVVGRKKGYVPLPAGQSVG